VNRRFLRVGHKGADALVPGNTIASFERAVELGVDVIELDVLRPRSDFARDGDWRRAAPGPAEGSGPLLVAHDWGDAARRDPATLAEVLDAFTRPPLDEVRINLDLKIAGREDEVAQLLRERDLLGRALVSTMVPGSLRELARVEPALPRGWTLPRVTRDWTRTRWARPLLAGGMASMRARLPGIIRRGASRHGVWAAWVYHPLITPRLVRAAHQSGLAVIAWTVDDAASIHRLLSFGVDGICTNDPRLLDGAPAAA
jgi:glycerophosphoryl diester phosphodiesterase